MRSESNRLANARRWRVAVVLILLAGAALRAYREAVPWGASPAPWLLASDRVGMTAGPAGGTIEIRMNDAGAAHSGNHWTWIVGHHWLIGCYVAASGYRAVPDESVELRWVGDRQFVVRFVADRYGNDSIEVTGNVW